MVLKASEVDAHVGQRMRQLRESLGISQGRLGRHLGLTFSQVQKYEKGTNRIGAGRLYMLASFLGVPVQYFYEGLDDTAATGGSNSLKGAEIAALEDAFLSIDNSETRRSVVALVTSLAESADPRARRRRTG